MLPGNGKGTPYFGLGSGHAGIGFRLIGLQTSADVFPHIDISDVNRHNLKGSVGVQAALQHRFADPVGVFQHAQMVFRRSDGRDDAFTHPGNNGFLRCPADQLLQIGAYGNAGFYFQFDPILRNG